MDAQFSISVQFSGAVDHGSRIDGQDALVTGGHAAWVRQSAAALAAEEAHVAVNYCPPSESRAARVAAELGETGVRDAVALQG